MYHNEHVWAQTNQTLEAVVFAKELVYLLGS